MIQKKKETLMCFVNNRKRCIYLNFILFLIFAFLLIPLNEIFHELDDGKIYNYIFYLAYAFIGGVLATLVKIIIYIIFFIPVNLYFNKFVFNIPNIVYSNYFFLVSVPLLLSNSLKSEFRLDFRTAHLSSISIMFCFILVQNKHRFKDILRWVHTVLSLILVGVIYIFIYFTDVVTMAMAIKYYKKLVVYLMKM